jgi:hypothetical protein
LISVAISATFFRAINLHLVEFSRAQCAGVNRLARSPVSTMGLHRGSRTLDETIRRPSQPLPMDPPKTTSWPLAAP